MEIDENGIFESHRTRKIKKILQAPYDRACSCTVMEVHVTAHAA